MFHCASAFAQAEKFGWELQFNVRKYGGGTMRTDICVIDPKDREKIYSVVGVYRKLGIPRDLFTPVFAIARVAGWLAHWREQLGANRIFRPSQIYSGSQPRAWMPMDERVTSPAA